MGFGRKKKVDRRRYIGFVSEQFGINISPSTASTYLAEFELTRRMMGSRPRDPGVSFEQYTKEGYDYIVDLHNSGFFLQEPSLVWAVDFTSTAIKQQRYFTYGPKGGKQQKYSKGKHVYTDNIFTSVGLDGSIIPPHAFSANPELGPNSPVKVQLCQQYEVDPDTVLFCPESGNWVGETASMVYSVVKKYSWKDCYVIHDDGNSWKPKGVDIFYEYKAARVSVMPHNPHGELSPCDCNYHSVAKEAERASRPDDASDAEITIRTLHYLGNVKAESVQSFWTRNFMLDAKKLLFAAYVDMLKGRNRMNEERNQLHSACIAAYGSYMAQDGSHVSE
jgi:hypothetical protein